jgi:hypothetical protein
MTGGFTSPGMTAGFTRPALTAGFTRPAMTAGFTRPGMTAGPARRGMTAASACLILLFALGLATPPAHAQQVTFTGEARDSASRVIASILERGAYTRIDRDTTLAAGAAIPGDLVIVGATVRLSGRVDGSVAVLGGELFVRPGAVITGPIAVASGAVYPSRLATTGPVLEVAPRRSVSITREGDGYDLSLTGPPPPRRIRPTGAFGVAIPRYDRVSGLTLAWGTRVVLGGSPEGAFARGSISYATERGDFGGSAGIELPVGGAAWLVAEVSRGADTNDGWIRGDVANSAAALAVGSDARDYHESDIAALTLVRRQPQPLVQGESFLAPRLVLRVSRDRSLEAGDPWKLTGDDWRANPGISDGTLASVAAGAAYAWRGRTATFDGDAVVEWAPPSIGDYEFAQVVADGRWGMLALWTHRIDLRARVMMPLGSAVAPLQRWSFVGGPGTLATLDYGTRRGDHLVFLRSDYSIPLPRVRLPLVGEPILRASHAVGSAWVTGGGSPRWDQNLGGGVVLSLVDAMIWVDPAADPLKPVLALGVTLPL